MGKSRSATCVIAYLMAKYKISPQEALAQVRQARPLVEPNEGFMQQLEMYHQMQTPINVEDSPVYQRWMYQREVQVSSECGQAPDADKIRFEDEHIASDDEGNFADTEFKCKKCR
jgi:dual specificity phosphatase 12